MNELGILLVGLSVQVTVLTLAGLMMTLAAARATPATGARLTLGALAGTTLLTVLAFCPLPSWWTWEAMPSDHSLAANRELQNAQPAASQPPGAAPDSLSTGGPGLAGLLSSLRNLGRGRANTESPAGLFASWPALVALVVGIGAFVSLLRLLLGVTAIRRGWRRSKAVQEPSLLHLVEELRRTLGLRRPVNVRVWPDLGTAATVGWLRPVLLLPGDWESWTCAQRRAVMAHELAHVARGDFAAGLLARLSLALHFWHPLVRLLVRRFQLQRELAADAQAAPLAGGRAGYLRVLAELALRLDGRAQGWPAPALLSSQGTLLRRIGMLRVEKRAESKPGRGRWLAVGLCLCLTLAVSALRAGVEEKASEAAAAAQSQPVVPFDVSLVLAGADKDTAGIYAIRPAALFSRASLAPLRQSLNAQHAAFSERLHLGKSIFQIEDIDQVIGRISFQGEKNKPGKRNVVCSFNMVRMTRDIDWARLREQYHAKTREHHWKGETYVRISLPPVIQALLGPASADVYFWAVDARTLLCDTERNIKALIEAKSSGRKSAPPAFAAGWSRMNKGLLTLALDCRGERLLAWLREEDEPGATPDPKDQYLEDFCKNASHVVVGFAGADDLQGDLWACAASPARAEAMARSCRELKAALGKEFLESKIPPSDPLQVMLRRSTVQRDGSIVTVHTSLPSGFNELLAAWAREFAGSE
jgi:beta-lactamase regulating signal transducer with metallopeptidase domain